MRSVVLRRVLRVATLGCALTGASSAWAATRCPVSVDGPPDASWQSAASELERSLASAPGDCDRVVVVVRDSGATVTYRTRDGRTAERTVPSPDELASTVDALRVTGPISPVDAPAPAPPVRPRPAPVVDRRPTAESDATATRFALETGVRGGDERLFSPMLGGFAGLGVSPWEIGIRGSWEVGYRQLGDELHRGALGTGLAAGVLAGRRQRMGPAEGFAGIALMLASIDQEARERSTGGEDPAHSEARAGAYLGAALPAHASVRVRASLGADVVPLRWGNTVRDERGAPVLPWWAVSVTLGIETATR